MRKLEFNRGIVVVPQSLVNGADREVEVSRTEVFVVYPDGITGTELQGIITAATGLAAEADDDSRRGELVPTMRGES